MKNKFRKAYVEVTKRNIDFLFSTVALIFFFPFLVVISILIKKESKGPVFFKQKRIGENNKEFTIYKFRSMKIETPDVATDKLENSSQYITQIGAFIRKTSIDELPQLINIVKGDMSIVGPRPALYNQYELTKKRTENNIHKLKPGLTGYAQIKGRDFISDEKKVIYDKHYAEHISLWTDLKIIIMTFISVLKSDGIKN